MEQSSSDDKLFAGASYLGNFLCCMIPAIAIFFIKKDESPYIKFHSLQAIFLGVVAIVIGIVLAIVGLILTVVMGAILPPLALLAQIPQYLFGLAYVVYCIILAVQVFGDNSPEIPYIGSFIQEKIMS
jgi:uncharacterized membrane protein